MTYPHLDSMIFHAAVLYFAAILLRCRVSAFSHIFSRHGSVQGLHLPIDVQSLHIQKDVNTLQLINKDYGNPQC